ncbi:hypothetical protein EGR_03054 [Echinococcus granulosus]|uniref:Uncharacterized protein n=1 Tax=Echinococcus granulosus TaxID=6210 RepID=W6ULW1_ECHGR|nr:hypothetical protein EGR_03054 [Echinococcus granulosus]EUB62033.1 hypothetical protein EGR_03054 [Echinococcus granulosus]
MNRHHSNFPQKLCQKCRPEKQLTNYSWKGLCAINGSDLIYIKCQTFILIQRKALATFIYPLSHNAYIPQSNAGTGPTQGFSFLLEKCDEELIINHPCAFNIGPLWSDNAGFLSESVMRLHNGKFVTKSVILPPTFLSHFITSFQLLFSHFTTSFSNHLANFNALVSHKYFIQIVYKM